jgi:hypothetical protein
MLLSVPWSATDLPVPVASRPNADDDGEAVLLAPAALLALVRFLRHRSAPAAIVEPTPRRNQ